MEFSKPLDARVHLPTWEAPPGAWTAGSARRLALFLVVGLLFALSLYRFVRLDLLRLAYPVNDLTAPWVSAQAFLRGQNPYGDTPELEKIWAATDVPPSRDFPDYNSILLDRPMAFPPTALALLAPLGWLPWHAATVAFVVGSMILFVFAVLLLARNLPLPWHDPRKLYFVAFALAMFPLHAGSQQANPNTLTVAFLCAGVSLTSRKPAWSGVTMAVAVCLKPQIAVLLYSYMWLRKKWKAALTALTAGSALTTGCLVWMWAHGVGWLKPFLEQLAQIASPVGRNGFYPPAPSKFQMLNLQVLTVQFTREIKWSGILAWAIFAVLGGMAVYLIHTRISDENESAGIAVVAVLTLLSFYQRFYAAEILVFVLYWAVENWRLKAAKASLILMLPLLFPFALWLAAFEDASFRGPAAGASVVARVATLIWGFIRNHNLEASVLWNGFVMANVIWIELILVVILFASLGRRRAGHAAAVSGRTFETGDCAGDGTNVAP